VTHFSSKPKTKLTVHQLDILSQVIKGNADGSMVDIYQLLDRVTRKVVLQSMQTTLRALIIYGMVEKAPREVRSGRSLMVYRATPLGTMIAGGGAPTYAFVGGDEEGDDAQA
jgi:predicted transcriptional regulator